MVATSSYRKTFQAPVLESRETGSVSRMVRYHASLSSSVCARVADILITLRWHCRTGLTGQFDPGGLLSTVDRRLPASIVALNARAAAPAGLVGAVRALDPCRAHPGAAGGLGDGPQRQRLRRFLVDRAAGIRVR